MYCDKSLYLLAEVKGENEPGLEIPKSLQETVWKQLHKDLGHLGIQRTHASLRRQYN